MITIQEIANLHHKNLKSISSKLIYMMIRNQCMQHNWSTISLNDFASSTGMPVKSVARILKRLTQSGLIEKNPEKETQTSINQYRTIEI